MSIDPNDFLRDYSILGAKPSYDELEPKTYEQYQQLRRADRNIYYSTKVQTQMQKDRARLGKDAFFRNNKG